MARGDTVVRFDEVTFGYREDRILLDEASFSIREGSKITIMGQNGAGKSTIFNMITKKHLPMEGKISLDANLHIAIAKQVMPPEDKELTIQAYFRKYSRSDAHNIDREIAKILDAVDLKAPLDRIVSSFSWGQQARLLLASALIQHPDILLLDEPTNNLDAAGIWHLTQFLCEYDRTVIVISHDAIFLNAFTDGVLYLDIFTKKVEQYVWDYFDVVEQIERRIEAQNRENARIAKEIQANKDQANVFAHKWGKLRDVARKMRDRAEELEESKVDVRREDKTIRNFTIPNQEWIGWEILGLSSVKIIVDHEAVEKPVDVSLWKNRHLLLSGPNGIGKSTLLESIASQTAIWMRLGENVKIGYYRQDFSTLDFGQTVYESLRDSAGLDVTEQNLRSMAAGFLINGDLMKTQIGLISEGQKWLVMFCKLVFEKPGLLILDEPTNHINFRHLPVIAQALSEYEWTMVLVSHIDEFVKEIRIDEEIDLGKVLRR